MSRSYKDVEKYVHSQIEGKVVSVKPEQKFHDLGSEVNVWNVKTDIEENWWVVEGEESPMNLYSQGAYYFTTDEVYSFHIGLMERVSLRELEYTPENFVKSITLDAEIRPILFRKLKSIANLIDDAIEIEDFQSIGVQCREILIELGNSIYLTEMARADEQPQASNFKKKAELFVKFYLSGANNKDYRSITKKMTEATWDYACKITHSQNASYYEASTCVTLITSLVSVYENIKQKAADPISRYHCNYCKSKKLNIISDEHNQNDIVTKLFLQCVECEKTTEVLFEDLEK